MVVRTGIMDQTVRTLVTTDIMAETVPGCVHLIAKLAMSQMESVHVRLVGWVLPVPLHVYSLMEKIVGILAVPTVTISHVTDLMDDAIIVVQADSMVNFVMKDISCRIKMSRVRTVGSLD